MEAVAEVVGCDQKINHLPHTEVQAIKDPTGQMW